MEETDDLAKARATRRAMLGDAYVDAQAADPNPVMGEFQDYITSMAWGVWARGGALSPRDRSLMVLAMTAALGRMDEFRLHAGAPSGPASPTRSSTSCCSRSPPTAERRPESRPSGPCRRCGPSRRAT